MLEICWYCDSPIDVDEAVEGQVQIHKDCLLGLATSGSWDSLVARSEQQKEQHRLAIVQIDRNLRAREITILAAN